MAFHNNKRLRATIATIPAHQIETKIEAIKEETPNDPQNITVTALTTTVRAETKDDHLATLTDHRTNQARHEEHRAIRFVAQDLEQTGSVHAHALDLHNRLPANAINRFHSQVTIFTGTKTEL